MPIFSDDSINLFGFEIKRKKAEKEKEQLKSFVAPAEEDGVGTVVNAGGHFGSYVNIDVDIQSEKDLILKYRDVAQQPECDAAIEDIVSEAIISDDDSSPVQLILDDLDLSEPIKKKIHEEFETIVELLNFNWRSHDLFRRWYVDGRLYFHKIINDGSPKKGLQELRYIDPTKIKKVKEIQEEIDPKTKVKYVKEVREFYVFQDDDMAQTSQGVKIFPDSISYVTSGVVDGANKMVLSHLHKALKPTNQLRMMEDSIVIYRISRAPERRIFYIDVGNLPKGKAEEYMKNIMAKYRNKMVYDAQTGELRNDRKHMCLAMDTKVPLLDGRTLTIAEIAEEHNSGETLWAYSCDPETGKFAPGLISWAGETRKNAEVVKLTLDNGKTIVCTPDHKFPVWNKGFVRADELDIGESMIPHYSKHEKLNTATARIVAIEHLEERIDTGCITIDGDHLYHDHHTFALDAGIYTKNSMLEDFWLPRREGRGTEIDTLPSGQNLGDIEDLIYFQQRLYRSLNVPVSRLEPDNAFSMGRSTEITRDELKFNRFINRLRKRFSLLFIDLLRTQLILKGIIHQNEWADVSQKISIDFLRDNHFSELKDAELLQDRLAILRDIEEYKGVYYSQEWIRKNVLMQNDQDIELIDKQIKGEGDTGSSDNDETTTEKP